MSSSQSEYVFNGPFKRNKLLNLPQYTAHSSFADMGSWCQIPKKTGRIFARTENGVTEPVYCITVGRVSSNKLYLATHGNFNPNLQDDVLKAKLQFTLVAPRGDLDFEGDFESTLRSLEKVQQMGASSPNHKYLIVLDDGKPSIRMSFPLFEPKLIEDADREQENIQYRVSLHESYWREAKKTNYCCLMPTFKADSDTPIHPSMFADVLEGALVEVTYTLRHFSMQARGDSSGSDIFGAHMESVVILKDPSPLQVSPFKKRTGRPQHKPQGTFTPTRGEQINSAKAFVPPPRIEFNASSNSTTQASASGSPVKSSSVTQEDIFGPMPSTQPPPLKLKQRAVSKHKRGESASSTTSTPDSQDTDATKKLKIAENETD